MKEKKYYDKHFFAELEEGSYFSAKNILPFVQEVFKPESVVDIGCGSGYWLKVWKEDMKVDEILGIEGDYVTKEFFQLDLKYLKTADLKLPLKLEKKYDLVMSMEVAEHIPEEHSDTFIDNLVNAGDVILFSAAIIGQVGTYHVNEKMPEYWAQKFIKHGYVPVDFIRPRIWNNNDIQYWYRQNTLIFIKESRLHEFPQLNFAVQATDPNFLTRIHPDKYFFYVEENKQLKNIIGFIRYKLYPLKKWLKHRI